MKVELVLWSVLLSSYAWNPDKIRQFEELWGHIWSREGNWKTPWNAKVPIPVPPNLPGSYALIHGYGCVEGYAEIAGPTPGWLPGEGESQIYEVQGDISKMTKRRLKSWLRKVYPQRFRVPSAISGLNISWSELPLIGSPERVEALRQAFVEESVQQSIRNAPKDYYLSVGELETERHDARSKFNETLHAYRKRRRRSLKQALADPSAFVHSVILIQPWHEYFLIGGHPMAFMRVLRP